MPTTGVDAGRVQLIDLIPRGDAHRQPSRGASWLTRTAMMACMSVPPHQALAIDVGDRNSEQNGSSARHGLDRGDRQDGLPAVDDDVAAAAVDGGDHAIRRRRLRRATRANATSTAPSRKSAELAITACAPASSTSRARSTTGCRRPRGREAGRRSHDTMAALSPLPVAASRSISCTRGKLRELADPRLGVRALRWRGVRPARAGRRRRPAGRWTGSACSVRRVRYVVQAHGRFRARRCRFSSRHARLRRSGRSTPRARRRRGRA